MKFILYILMLLLPLLNLQGQSQLLKGTIKAKKNYSYTYLPSSTETKTPEPPKPSVEDFYPPNQYTLPPNNNFKALTFNWGSFIAAKNQPIVLEPQPIDTVPANAPKKEGVLDPLEPENSFASTGVLDPLDPIPSSNKNTAPQTLTPIAPASSPQNNVQQIATSAIKEQKSVVLTPAKPASTIDAPKSNTYNANNGSILLTPTRPATAPNNSIAETNNSSDRTTILAKPAEKAATKPENIVTPNNTTATNTASTTSISSVNNSIKADYKIYLDEYGKYNVVFAKDGCSITVSQFGRVNAVVIPTNGNIKPTYNYRGLLESVGGLQLLYTYEGRVLSVGGTQLTYNYNGNIETINGIAMLYNANGSIGKIGNAKMIYDYNGKITNVESSNATIVMKQ